MRRFIVFFAVLLSFCLATLAQTSPCDNCPNKKLMTVPSSSEIDEVDKLAVAWFQNHADGKEHFLVNTNDLLHDVTFLSTESQSWIDPKKLAEVMKSMRSENRMVFFHNHPSPNRFEILPSSSDFGYIIYALYYVYQGNSDFEGEIEFRVIRLGQEVTSVSYGLKGETNKQVEREALEDILIFRKAQSQLINESLGSHTTDETTALEEIAAIQTRQGFLYDSLERDSFNWKFCPVDLKQHNPETCTIHPQYVLRTSDKFFLHYRGKVVQK